MVDPTSQITGRDAPGHRRIESSSLDAPVHWSPSAPRNAALLSPGGDPTSMNHRRAAPLAGIVACVLAVVAVLAPYVAVPEGQVGVVGQYYGVGLVTPLAIGVMALVGVIAFASGLKERSDPSLVAGLMVAVGVVSLLSALQWVFAVPARVGPSAATADFLAVHRWSILAVAALIAAAAVWYAWSLGLVGGRAGVARDAR